MPPGPSQRAAIRPLTKVAILYINGSPWFPDGGNRVWVRILETESQGTICLAQFMEPRFMRYLRTNFFFNASDPGANFNPTDPELLAIFPPDGTILWAEPISDTTPFIYRILADSIPVVEA